MLWHGERVGAKAVSGFALTPNLHSNPALPTAHFFAITQPSTPTEYDEGGRYALLIEDAHRAASAAAMELLRRGENLANGLAVLKRYFLTAQVCLVWVGCWQARGGGGLRNGRVHSAALPSCLAVLQPVPCHPSNPPTCLLAHPPQQGDMLLHLMDAAEPEFGSHVGSVPLLQLQSLLESAVRGTSAAADPAAAKLAACFDHRSILNMLIANQQALAAVPGAEGGSKTPFSKVGSRWRVHRCGQLHVCSCKQAQWPRRSRRSHPSIHSTSHPSAHHPRSSSPPRLRP